MDTLDALPTGLYDCLKQYRLADLANMTIDSCEQFNKIKEVAKKAMDNGVQMSKDYDDSPDSTITVMNWIKKVQNKIDHKSKTAGFSELADKPITTSLPKDNGTLANKVRETKQNRAQKGNSAQSKEKSVKDKKSLLKSDSKKSSIPKQSEW